MLLSLAGGGGGRRENVLSMRCIEQVGGRCGHLEKAHNVIQDQPHSHSQGTPGAGLSQDEAFTDGGKISQWCL